MRVRDPALPAKPSRRQADPDPAQVARLYLGGATEKEIARLLSVSRQRVADALTVAGVQRRQPASACPVSHDELRRLVDAGSTQAQLAARFAVASGTMCRWLAEAGIGDPDPRIDHARLRHLYVDRELTAREVAIEFGTSHNRVIRELALAGIARRSRHDRRPRGARAAVTDEALRALYVDQGLSVRELRGVLGVSDEYLRKRLRECGFAKRPGTFVQKLARPRDDLSADAAELYSNAKLSMREVAEALGISSSHVRELLHESGVEVRAPGVRAGRDERPRRVLQDLYADRAVRSVLERFGVPVQDPTKWTRPSPFETFVTIPIPEQLLQELYVDLGLSGFHIALLCGVGTLAVMNRLRHLNVGIRPSGQPCPWTVRTYGS